MNSLNDIFNTHPISPRLLETLTPYECNNILKQVVDLPVDIPHNFEKRYMSKNEITYYFTKNLVSCKTHYLLPVCLYLGDKLMSYYDKPNRCGWNIYYSNLIMFLIDKVRGVKSTIDLGFSLNLNDIKYIIEKSDKQIFVLSGKSGSGKTKLSTDIIKKLDPNLALFICNWYEHYELEKWLDEKYPIIYNRGYWDDVSTTNLIKILNVIEKENKKLAYIVFDFLPIFDEENSLLGGYVIDWCKRNDTKIIVVSPQRRNVENKFGWCFTSYFDDNLIMNLDLNYERRNDDIYIYQKKWSYL